MMELLPSLFLGFVTVYLGAPYAKTYLMASGIFGVDQQKEEKPWIPTSGGVLVLFGFIVSITSFLGVSSILNLDIATQNVLAALGSVTIIALIGLLDDIHVNIELIVEEELDIEMEKVEFDFLNHYQNQLPHQKASKIFRTIASQKETGGEMIREGLGQTPKMLFVIPAVFPLMVVGAGSNIMKFPLVGTVDWGIAYPLVLLPLGLLFTSNVVNMLAGTNGLSASLTAVTSAAVGTRALMAGSIESALIAFSLTATLAAFLRYNFYPASFLPGDSLTYLTGGGLFSAIVIGNMEKFGAFIFALYMTEFLLKARSGFNARSWGILQEDNSLKPQHDKIYSLTHVFMRKGYNEKQVTEALTVVQVIICVAGLGLAGAGVL